MRRSLSGLAAVAAPAVVCLAAACAIPARDNDHDPSRIPEASLVVYVSSTNASIEGTQTTTFTLDASGSRDPKGRTLHFSWDLDDDPDFEITDDASVECENGLRACLRTPLLVPPTFPASGIGAATRTVRVKVKAGGTSAIAEAVAILVNDAPVLDLAEDLFVYERVQPTVTLDPCALATPCSSADPDGDPIDWSWTQVPGIGDAVVLTTSGDGSGIATFVAPADPQELLFELTASDGLTASRARLRVRVGTQVWVGTADPVGLYRIHPDFLSRAASDAATGVEAYLDVTALAADPSDGILWYAETDELGSAAVLHRASPSLATLASWDLGAGYVAGIVATGGNALVALNDGVAIQTVLQRFDATGPVGSPISLNGFTSLIEPGPRPGSTWVVAQDFSIVDADGTVETVVPTPSFGTLKLFARDASDGSLWTFYETDFGSFVGHLHPDGSTENVTSPTGFSAPRALAPHPDGGVWLHTGDSLVRIAPDLSITDEPEVSTFATPGSVTYGERFTLATDASRRELWIAERPTQRLVRYELGGDGTLHRAADLLLPPAFETRTNSYLSRITIDRRGGRVFAVGQAGIAQSDDFLALIPRHLKRIETIALGSGSAYFVSGDPVRGAAWVSPYTGFQSWFSDESPAQRLASSGRRLATIAPDGAAVPLVGDVHATRDGGAWLSGYFMGTGDGTLFHVDGLGEVEQQIPIADPNAGTFGAGLFRMAVSDDETKMCGTTQRPFEVQQGYGPFVRGDLAAGTAEMIDGASPGSGMDVAATDDGVCWFLDAGNYNATLDTCTTFPNGGLFRVEGAGVAYVGTAGGLTFTCPHALALDRRDGSVWVSDTVANRGHVFRLSDSDLSTMGSWDSQTPGIPNRMEVRELCGDAASYECAELWFSSAAASFIARSRANGGAQLEILETFQMPAGHPVALDVAP